MKNTQVGALLQSKKFPNLKWVIQTGFRTIRGILKLKNIPVYNKLKYLKSPLESVELAETSPLFTYKASPLTHQDVLKFAGDFHAKSKLKPGDILVNCLSHKLPITAATALSSSMNGTKSVLVGKNDGMYFVNDQQAKALLISEDRAHLVTEPGAVDLLVVAADSQGAVEKTESALKDRGVQAKSVVGYNPATLAAL